MFKKFSDKELYMLKRAFVELPTDIHYGNYSAEEVKIYSSLFNIIIDEIKDRESGKATEGLMDVIEQDCKHYEQLVNADAMIENYMYLNECKNSKTTGLYQLILNGRELYYGTLSEINAIVKSMLTLIDRKEDYTP